MNKTKILYTIPNFDTAGSGKVLYDLAKGLDTNRFEVHIACHNDKGVFFKQIKELKKPIHFLNITQPYRPYLTLIARLKLYRKLLKDHKIDIVHSWHWSSDWTEALACRLSGVKYIYTKKAMTWGNKHWKIKSLLSHFIITINDDMKAYFPWKRNQRLIPLGLDTNYYSTKSLDKINDNQRFTIVSVANLVPVKGIEVLISSLMHLDHQNIQLIVVGDTRDAYADYLLNEVKKNDLIGIVNFTGKQPDIRPYLSIADLFVISSKKEGMPMALVEAMSMGIPVLGSDVSGINYVLKEFKNLLFEAGNSIELSEKINEIIEMGKIERNTLGNNLRNYVTDNFSYNKFIKNHEDLYISLIK